VRDAAEFLGTSEGYVLRLAFRKMVGLPVGGSGETDYDLLAKTGTDTRPTHVQFFDGPPPGRDNRGAQPSTIRKVG